MIFDKNIEISILKYRNLNFEISKSQFCALNVKISKNKKNWYQNIEISIFLSALNFSFKIDISRKFLRTDG